MSKIRQAAIPEVLVRFWSLDHHRAEPVLWTESDWPKLVYTLEGVLHVESETQLHILPPNRALMIPPGAPHPSRTMGRAKVRTLFLCPSLAPPLPKGVLDVRPLFRELISEACRVGPLIADNPLHSSLARLLLSEIRSAPTLAMTIPMPRTDWVRAWAHQFLAEPDTFPEPPAHRRTLERKLESETGLTLGRWRHQARSLLALQSLSTGATVLEAATLSGYSTSSGFIQSFKKQFGLTPGKIPR